jgi:nitrogen fixation/metabolism regulation signal transduction histidine kinase
MNLRNKLILGFVVIALLSGVISYIEVQEFKSFSASLQLLPETVQTAQDSTRLLGLAEVIRYYDEVLTQSARNYAFTKDKQWRQRYLDAEPALDAAITEAVAKGDATEKSFFSAVNESNIALVILEHQSLDEVDKGNAAEAVRILESTEYWHQKAIYANGLTNYFNARGVQKDRAFENSAEAINRKINDVTQITARIIRQSYLYIAALILGAILLGIFIARSLSEPLASLLETVVAVTKGDVDRDISPTLTDRKDEIGTLASAFEGLIVASRNRIRKEIAEKTGKRR